MKDHLGMQHDQETAALKAYFNKFGILACQPFKPSEMEKMMQSSQMKQVMHRHTTQHHVMEEGLQPVKEPSPMKETSDTRDPLQQILEHRDYTVVRDSDSTRLKEGSETFGKLTYAAVDVFTPPGFQAAMILPAIRGFLTKVGCEREEILGEQKQERSKVEYQDDVDVKRDSLAATPAVMLAGAAPMGAKVVVNGIITQTVPWVTNTAAPWVASTAAPVVAGVGYHGYTIGAGVTALASVPVAGTTIGAAATTVGTTAVAAGTTFVGWGAAAATWVGGCHIAGSVVTVGAVAATAVSTSVLLGLGAAAAVGVGATLYFRPDLRESIAEYTYAACEAVGFLDDKVSRGERMFAKDAAVSGACVVPGYSSSGAMIVGGPAMYFPGAAAGAGVGAVVGGVGGTAISHLVKPEDERIFDERQAKLIKYLNDNPSVKQGFVAVLQQARAEDTIDTLYEKYQAQGGARALSKELFARAVDLISKAEDQEELPHLKRMALTAARVTGLESLEEGQEPLPWHKQKALEAARYARVESLDEDQGMLPWYKQTALSAGRGAGLAHEKQHLPSGELRQEQYDVLKAIHEKHVMQQGENILRVVQDAIGHDETQKPETLIALVRAINLKVQKDPALQDAQKQFRFERTGGMIDLAFIDRIVEAMPKSKEQQHLVQLVDNYKKDFRSELKKEELYMQGDRDFTAFKRLLETVPNPKESDDEKMKRGEETAILVQKVYEKMLGIKPRELSQVYGRATVAGLGCPSPREVGAAVTEAVTWGYVGTDTSRFAREPRASQGWCSQFTPGIAHRLSHETRDRRRFWQEEAERTRGGHEEVPCVMAY